MSNDLVLTRWVRWPVWTIFDLVTLLVFLGVLSMCEWDNSYVYDHHGQGALFQVYTLLYSSYYMKLCVWWLCESTYISFWCFEMSIVLSSRVMLFIRSVLLIFNELIWIDAMSRLLTWMYTLWCINRMLCSLCISLVSMYVLEFLWHEYVNLCLGFCP